MRPDIIQLAIVTLVVVIDNALLGALLLPPVSRPTRMRILWAVGSSLAVLQVAIATGIGRLLYMPLFRVVAILALVWMAIKTIVGMGRAGRSDVGWMVIASVFFYTALGNLDNMIWLGMMLRGHYIWLSIYSVVTVPVFVFIAIFLADQCERYLWIPVLGAGMMASAAASLCAGILAPKVMATMPYGTFYILFTLSVVGLAFLVRNWMGNHWGQST